MQLGAGGEASKRASSGKWVCYSFHSCSCCATFQLKRDSSLLLLPSPCDRKCRLKRLHVVFADKVNSTCINFESGLLWFGLPTARLARRRLPPSSSGVHVAPRIPWALCWMQTFSTGAGKKKAESSTVAVHGLCDLLSG